MRVKVEAELEDGFIRLPNGVRLKPGRHRVVVHLPEAALADAEGARDGGDEPGAPGRRTSAIRSRIDGILGAHKSQLKPAETGTASAADHRELWYEHQERKHLGG